MILIPILALLVGAVIGLLIKFPLLSTMGMYLAICSIAALDTICGGVRSLLEGSFSHKLMLSGFISNILIAFFLAWLGDHIGLDLHLAIAVILGGRVFCNLSAIRRHWLNSFRG